VTANLGVALAHLGKTVVLVSADGRDPRLERVFGLPSDLGLTSVLAAEVPLARALCKTDVADLMVLPAGSDSGSWSPRLAAQGPVNSSSNGHHHRERSETRSGVVPITHRLAQVGYGPTLRGPTRRPAIESASVLSASAGGGRSHTSRDPIQAAEAVSVERQLPVSVPAGPSTRAGTSLFNIAPILDEAQSQAEIVLVDAPPLLTATDTALLLDACDAVLFVANERSLTRSALDKVGEELRRADAHVIGAALVGGRRPKSTHRFSISR
jgi:hypothetical protein